MPEPPDAPGFYWVLLHDNVGGAGEPTVVLYLPSDGPLLSLTVLGSGDAWGADAVRVWGPRIQEPEELRALARP